ncbi:hypothetical protein EJ04DRAFT_568287 [Polyplosphaeria fusca]|uniref:Uncharacterized protein n=1 Tax=Polyplosphaeria fusca TaxID=682080 RepID=A0A9P4QS28_9PLEO|nr:hypothetical protein EJ04DRAFT_568287 [Polyplosphaeria fusca]
MPRSTGFPSPTVVKQDVVPDIRILDERSRKRLLNGPNVILRLGSVAATSQPIMAISKKALMACSPTANEFFSRNRTEMDMHLSPKDFTSQAIEVLGDYIRGVCCSRHAFDLKPEETLTETIDVYRAAKAWKMDTYLQVIRQWLLRETHQFFGNISAPLPFDLLDKVTMLDSADEIFITAACAFASKRFKKELPLADEFNQWLASHESFAAAMDTINQQM